MSFQAFLSSTHIFLIFLLKVTFIPHKILCVVPFQAFRRNTCWFTVPRTFSPKECKTGAHILFQGSNVNNNLSFANNGLLLTFPHLKHVLWNQAEVHDHKFKIYDFRARSGVFSRSTPLHTPKYILVHRGWFAPFDRAVL